MTINWGIISTGGIAGKMADAINQLRDDAQLLAVGSRSQSSADEFADRFHIPRRYASYEDLVRDSDLDVIYIATPHPFHYENTLLALEHGKAVLCEKPLAMNARQSQEMIQTAREKGLFLMEGMWTRFLPLAVKVRELIAEGRIGEPRHVQATLTFRFDYDPSHRLFAPELGGGALLDLGIYPISFASMIFGRQPEEIISRARIGETGVDEDTSMLFRYDDEATALLYCSSRVSHPQSAIISGTEGFIELPDAFFMTNTMILHQHRQKTESITVEQHENGFVYEAAEVGRCLRAGLNESPTLTHDESQTIMQTMDAVMAQWGVELPYSL